MQSIVTRRSQRDARVPSVRERFDLSIPGKLLHQSATIFGEIDGGGDFSTDVGHEAEAGGSATRTEDLTDWND